MLRAFFSALVLSVVLSVSAFAQTGTLSGRITDADTNQPLPGATVQLVASERGAAADAYGRFTLRDVPSGSASVRVSFVGFLAQEATVNVASGETATLNVSLVADP
ncbi:MAG: carboxypeptidase-like regulatory domain-containing protein, partial [Bacteroidota bacterium]